MKIIRMKIGVVLASETLHVKYTRTIDTDQQNIEY
jgi:hypothetical protein